jgi:hypothetical protein
MLRHQYDDLATGRGSLLSVDKITETSTTLSGNINEFTSLKVLRYLIKLSVLKRESITAVHRKPDPYFVPALSTT